MYNRLFESSHCLLRMLYLNFYMLMFFGVGIVWADMIFILHFDPVVGVGCENLED